MISDQQLAKIQHQVQLEELNGDYWENLALMPNAPDSLQLVNLDEVKLPEAENLNKKAPAKPKGKKVVIKKKKKVDPLDKEPYFQVSQAIYQDSLSRINEEYQLRKEWIDEYSVDKQLEMSFLNGWKKDAMDMLNQSSISPAAREQVKAYIKEEQEMQARWAKAVQKHQDEIEKEEQMLRKRHAIGHCWNQVDFLESIWLHTYLTADDDIYGMTIYNNTQSHLNDQVKQCKRLEKKAAPKK